jgi:hypothetical protein
MVRGGRERGASRLRDETLWDTLSARYVQLARDAGALSELPRALTARAYFLLFTGELDSAAALVQELLAVPDETRMGLAPTLWLAALRGEEARAQALTDAILQEVDRRGEGVAITWTEWTNALLNNGLGHYDKAAAATWHASCHDEDPGALLWTLPELVEAATRTGMTEATEWARARMEEIAGASETDWGAGIRCAPWHC